MQKFLPYVTPEVQKIFTWGTSIGGMKIFSELETCANRFLLPENPLPPVPKISQFGAKIKKVEKIDFSTWGTPIGDHKKFFGT